ncbi:MAG: hypothetical protein RI900_1158, partial [Actinomycetota bacterium]
MSAMLVRDLVDAVDDRTARGIA